MGGHGTFVEPRTGVNVDQRHRRPGQRRSCPRLQALPAVSLARTARRRGTASIAAAAERGTAGLQRRRPAARPATAARLFTDANIRLHDPIDVVSEPEPNGAPSYASRSATKQYRTAPLRGALAASALLPQRHRARRSRRSCETYNTKKLLGLTEAEIGDLVQYLKSL